MRFAPTGKTLAFTSCVLLLLLGVGVALYHLLPAEPRWRFYGPDFELIGMASHPRILTWDSDGERLSQFRLHDAKTFSMTPILAGCVIEVPRPCPLKVTSANGEWLGILDDAAGKLWVASVQNGQERCVAVPKGMRSILAISGDGRMAALTTGEVSPKAAETAVLDLHSGATVLRESDVAYSAFFAGQGRFFVANLKAPSFGKVWDTATGRCILERPARFEQLDRDSDVSSHVWIHETSRCLWDLETQSALLQFKDSAFRSCTCSPNQRYCAVSVHRDAVIGQIEIVDVEANRVTLRLQTRVNPVFQFASDSQTLLVFDGGPDATWLQCYDLPTGKQRWSHRYEAVRIDPRDFAWAGTSEAVTLVEGSNRVCAHVHDLATGEVKATRLLTVGGNASVQPYFDDSGTLIEVETVLRSPWLRFLKTYLPMVPTPETHRQIVEMPSGKSSDISWLDSLTAIWVYRDVMVTIQPLERNLICYERPTHGPWRWVLGIPLGLGVLIAAAAWLHGLRKKQVARRDPRPLSNGGECVGERLT